MRLFTNIMSFMYVSLGIIDMEHNLNHSWETPPIYDISWVVLDLFLIQK